MERGESDVLRKIRVRISAHRNPLREAVLTGDFGLSIEREGSKGREQSLELVLSPQIRTTYKLIADIIIQVVHHFVVLCQCQYRHSIGRRSGPDKVQGEETGDWRPAKVRKRNERFPYRICRNQ